MTSVHTRAEDRDSSRLVRDFLAAVEDGDSERALSFLAPGFTLRSWGGNRMMDREGYRHAIGWDLASSSRKEIEKLEVESEVVTLILVERNDFTEILGLRPFRIETRFVVRDGTITEQCMREVPGEGRPPVVRDFNESTRPILEWGRGHAPELVERITGGGRAITYSARSGRALIDLIDRYRRREGGDG